MNTQTRCTCIVLALCVLLLGASGPAAPGTSGCAALLAAAFNNTPITTLFNCQIGKPASAAGAAAVCANPNAPGNQNGTCQVPNGANGPNAAACAPLNTCMGAAAGFEVTAPAAVANGRPFSFTVEALNTANGAQTNYTGTVHFTASPAGSADLPADTTLTNGQGTFTATLKDNVPNQGITASITATDTVNSSITGSTASISVEAATHFSVTAPANVTSGVAFSVVVTALDNSNNTVTGYPGKVQIGSSGPAARLPADATLTNGTGTFSVTLAEDGEPVQTITATDTMTSISGTSGNIQVTAVSTDPASHFLLTAPATVIAGVAFQLMVQALNDSNTPTTNYAGTIHFTSTGTAASALLPANSTLTNGAGTFTAVLHQSQQIVATDTRQTSITGNSSLITVQVAGAAEFRPPSAGPLHSRLQPRLQPMLSPAASLTVAAPCPPIVFNQPQNLQTVDFDVTGQNILASVLYRQPDGNFTAEGYTFPATTSDPTQLRAGAVGTHLGSIPQVQRYFANCRGLAPWAPVPHPTILANMPGTMSQALVVTNLGGAPYAEINPNILNASISVSLDSEGTFGQSTTNYSVGPGPIGILVADFNGDGKNDVAVLNRGTSSSPGSVSILLGLGSGLLGQAKTFSVGNGPFAMTSLDFNQDGHPDVAVVNQIDNTVTVLIANADGSMKQPGVTYALPGTAPTTNAIVAADFDGDGQADVMVYSALGFSLLHGNGDGTFQVLPQKTGYAVKFGSQFLAPGDFNKDGYMDLASYNSDGTVTILVNAGDGSFSTTNRYVAGSLNSAGTAITGMFATDFNDDGKLDVVFGTGHPDAIFANPAFVTLLLGNGDGTLQAPPSYRVGASTTVMASADFNGDNRPDLVVGANTTSATPGLWILLGAQGGGFQTATSLSVPSSGTFIPWVATGDLNGDGHVDLMAIDDTGKLFTWLGKGDGTFQTPSSFNGGAGASFVTAGDINGDGLADLAIAYGTPTATTGSLTQVVMATSTGTSFSAGFFVTTGINPLQVALADVNGDGKLDLIAVNHGVGNTGLAGAQPAPGNVSVLLGNGNGTFQPPASYTVGLNPISVAVADVNGDGKPDLIVGSVTDTAAVVGVLLNNGSGGFGAATLLPTYSWPAGIVAADFDGDGKKDLAIVHAANDPPMSIMRGHGDGTFDGETLLFAGSAPQSAIAANFTGHGKMDLAVSNLAGSAGASGTVNLFADLSGILPSAAHFLVSAPSAATPGTAFNFTVTAVDAGNNLVNTYPGTVQFTSTDASAVLPASATLVNGTGTFTATLKTGGSRTITATDTANSSVTGNSGAIAVATTATHLAVSAPGTATPGTAFQFTVTALDAGNNTVSGYSGTVHFSSSDSAAVLPANATLINGAGTFSATLKTAGSQTITATDTATTIAGTSSAIMVTPGPHFGFSTPQTALVGVPFSITLSAFDGNNNTLIGYAGTVHFTSTDSAAALPLNSKLTNGTGIFPVTFNTPGTWTITATDTVTSSMTGTSAGIPVTAPAAGAVGFTIATPASAVSGTAFNVTVTAVDANNNVVPSYAGTVQFSSTDPLAGLPANTRLNNGTGTFSTTLNTVGSQKISAVDTVNGSIKGTSSAINVGAQGAPPPTPVSVTPSSGSTSGGTYTLVFTDPRGYQDLDVVNLLVNNFIDGRHACYLAYSVPSSALFLVDDAGDAGGPFAQPGAQNTIQNSQCSVNLESAVGSGNTLTLVLNVNWTATFAGDKILYMAARDVAQNNSGWHPLGVLRVAGTQAGPIAVVSGGPGRGSGMGPTAFTFGFSDTKGFADLGVENVLVNSALDGRHACYIAYARSINWLYLKDDTGDILGAGQSFTTSGSLSNSQCTVSWGSGGVSTSGNNLTLTLNLAFTAAFDGDVIVYAAARDGNDLNSTDWHAMATWTVK